MLYRGPYSNKTLANFNDVMLNKGNFLEIIQFFIQRDSILNEHLQRSIKKKVNQGKLNLNQTINYTQKVEVQFLPFCLK